MWSAGTDWRCTAYQVLPDSLPLVNEPTDTLGALLLFGRQLPWPHRGLWPLALPGLCLLGLPGHPQG